MNQSAAKNKAYLEGLIAQIMPIPRAYAAEVAVRIFQGMVEHTRFDSGQAALNWHILPYVGTPSYENERIMWGYGGSRVPEVAPIPPAGMKWSKGENAEYIKTSLLEQSIVRLASLETETFDGIAVYNPITPNFAGFQPMTPNDLNYEVNALGEAKGAEEQIVESSISKAEFAVKARFAAAGAGAKK